MKKLTILLLVLTLALALCGCNATDVVNNIVNRVDDAITPKMSQEEVYENLDRLIGYTDGLENTDLTGSFEFVAIIYDEGKEIHFDDEDYTGYYYSAGISRNWNDYFMLDTMGLEGTFQDGDIVKVTGTTDGTIYWTEDNNRVEVLCVKASAIEAYAPEEIEMESSDTIILDDGNAITFLGAHATENSFGEAIVVYFEFKNNDDKEAAPSLREFYVEYNGEEASSTIFGLDEVDSSALKLGVGPIDKTYAGKSQVYYVAYTGDHNAANDEPIYFSLYDDEFRCTYDLPIDIAPSLADLQAE